MIPRFSWKFHETSDPNHNERLNYCFLRVIWLNDILMNRYFGVVNLSRDEISTVCFAHSHPARFGGPSGDERRSRWFSGISNGVFTAWTSFTSVAIVMVIEFLGTIASPKIARLQEFEGTNKRCTVQQIFDVVYLFPKCAGLYASCVFVAKSCGFLCHLPFVAFKFSFLLFFCACFSKMVSLRSTSNGAFYIPGSFVSSARRKRTRVNLK